MMVTDKEIEEILSSLENFDEKTGYDFCKIFYRKGYEQALADVAHINETGIIIP